MRLSPAFYESTHRSLDSFIFEAPKVNDVCVIQAGLITVFICFVEFWRGSMEVSCELEVLRGTQTHNRACWVSSLCELRPS
jgi:hypothetical protein